jgi:WD40 repeat protein
LEAPSRQIESIAFSPDQKAVVTAGGELWLWQAGTGKGSMLGGPRLNARCAAFTPDGKSLIVGSSEQTIQLWDPAKGSAVRSFTGEPGEVQFLAFLPDGKTVASMSRHRRFTLPNGTRWEREQQIRLWESPQEKKYAR